MHVDDSDGSWRVRVSEVLSHSDYLLALMHVKTT